MRQWCNIYFVGTLGLSLSLRQIPEIKLKCANGTWFVENWKPHSTIDIGRDKVFFNDDVVPCGEYDKYDKRLLLDDASADYSSGDMGDDDSAHPWLWPLTTAAIVLALLLLCGCCLCCVGRSGLIQIKVREETQQQGRVRVVPNAQSSFVPTSQMHGYPRVATSNVARYVTTDRSVTRSYPQRTDRWAHVASAKWDHVEDPSQRWSHVHPRPRAVSAPHARPRAINIRSLEVQKVEARARV